ncbi:MAG: respiratory nitrate reductase subunit gamma [Methermicoccaceae archaeon]
MMGMSAAFVGLFLVGLFIQLKKYGLGASEYEGPGKNSIIWFIFTILKMIFSRRLRTVVKVFILELGLQTRILKRSPFRWVMHLFISVGWMVLLFFSLLVFVFEILSLVIEQLGMEPMYYITTAFWRDVVLELPNDLFSYMLLIGLTIAIIRRIVDSKTRAMTEMYDVVLLGGLMIITLTGFLAEWFRGSSLVVGNAFVGFATYAQDMALFHVVISLAFCVALIPFTKYIHLIATPLVILATPTEEEVLEHA